MHTLEPMRAAIVMTGPTVRSRPPLPESTTVLCAYVTMARMQERVSILPMLLLAAKPLRMISPYPKHDNDDYQRDNIDVVLWRYPAAEFLDRLRQSPRYSSCLSPAFLSGSPYDGLVLLYERHEKYACKHYDRGRQALVICVYLGSVHRVSYKIHEHRAEHRADRISLSAVSATPPITTAATAFMERLSPTVGLPPPMLPERAIAPIAVQNAAYKYVVKCTRFEGMPEKYAFFSSLPTAYIQTPKGVIRITNQIISGTSMNQTEVGIPRMFPLL